jgi:hypothetical protein
MDEGFYRNLLGLIGAIQSPHTPHADRVNYTQALDATKNRADLKAYLLHILTTPNQEAHPSTVQFVALKLLEDWTLQWWNQLDVSAQRETRQSVVDLVGVHPELFESNRAVRSKLSKILAEIAKRQYPQEWPEFLEIIIQIWSASDGKAEIAIMTLEFLIEDCLDSDFNHCLPAQRRQDIIVAVRVHLEPLLVHAYEFLGRMVGLHGAAAENSPGAQTAGSLGKSVLRMVNALFLLDKPEVVCAPNHNFAAVLPQLMAAAAHREEGAALLNKLSNHRLTSELFLGLVMTVPVAIGAVPQEDDLLVLYSSLGESVFDLLATNFESCVTDKFLADPGQASALREYFDFAATLLNHPSKRLLQCAARSLTRVLREPMAEENKLPYLPFFVERCLQVYSARVVKPPLVNGQLADESIDLEFDDVAEYHDTMTLLKSQVALLCDVVAHKFPMVVAGFLHAKTQWLLFNHPIADPKAGTPQSNSTGSVASGGSGSSSSGGGGGGAEAHPLSLGKSQNAAIKEWDTFSFLLGACLSGISPSKYSSDPQLADAICAVVGCLLDFQPKDPLIVEERMKSTLRLAPYFNAITAARPGMVCVLLLLFLLLLLLLSSSPSSSSSPAYSY